jgi:Na+/melibiose symporter-like transporter
VIPERLRLSTLLVYAAPALPLAMLGIPLLVFLPSFWTGAMGMSFSTLGAVLFAVRAFDVVVDPTVGRLSDLSRSRFGRRKKYVAIAVPVAMIGAVGLFFPPAHAGWVWLAIFYALVTWGWTMLSLPYLAWGAELSADYRERQRITSYRDGAGTLLGIVISLTAPVAIGITSVVGEAHMLVVMTIVFAAPSLAALLWLVPDRLPKKLRDQPVGLVDALKVAAGNAPFRRLITVWLVNGLANGLPASLFIIVCAQYLHDEKAQGPLLLIYFVAGIACVPLWLWLGGRIGKHVAWIVSLIVTAAAFPFVLFVPHVGIWFFGLISVFTGSGLGADFTIPPAIQADVIDLDEYRSGERRAGLFFAASTMAQKAGAALSVIAFPILQACGFSQTGVNGPVALGALVFMYCGLPSLLKLVCAALLRGFPLNEAAQRKLRDDIALAGA